GQSRRAPRNRRGCGCRRQYPRAGPDQSLSVGREAFAPTPRDGPREAPPPSERQSAPPFPPTVPRIFLSLFSPLNSFLDRWQNRELFAGASQSQRIRVRGLFRDIIDQRRCGSAAASRDHIGHNIFGAFEHGLDTAVAPVSHPALQAQHARLMFDPSAVTHALHPAANHDVPGNTAHRGAPRNFVSRVFTSASRVTRAVKSADARPVKAFAGVPSRSALSVSKTALVAAAIGACP